MQIILPAQLNPISRRKDKSLKLSFETRELQADETMTLMSLEGIEGWITFSPNSEAIEIPEENAKLDTKTESQRMRSVLYRLYLQDTQASKFTGLFQSYYSERMEKLIQLLKDKLD